MNVCRTLRENLAGWREQGKPFSVAWPLALDLALSDVDDREELRVWRNVLASGVDEWRAAYERQPAKTPSVVSVLAERIGVPCSGRQCEFCDEDIPRSRGELARYCGDPCRRDAAKARERCRQRQAA